MYPPILMGANNSEIKQQNLSAILLNLLLYDEVARVKLAEQVGVSTSTITNLVNELIAAGLVSEEGVIRQEGQVGAGRPQRALHLVPDARYGIGVHIDVGYVHIGIANLRGKIAGSRTFSHSLDADWQDVLDQVCNAVNDLISELFIPQNNLVGVGVAASGLVDSYAGVNVFAPNLDWHDVPIGSYLEEKLELAVLVENNARAMALGELLFGHARSAYSTAFVYGRFGVGAGFVVGGQLFRGASAGAGEIGHAVMLLHPAGETGKHKAVCLEDLVSEPAILKHAEALISRETNSGRYELTAPNQLTLFDIIEFVRDGDAAMFQLIQERATYTGVALANLVNIFNPDLIVLGGIFQQYEDVFFPGIESAMRKYAFGNLSDKVRIVTTGFGERVGMIGAAALALDRFFYRPTMTPNLNMALIQSEVS